MKIREIRTQLWHGTIGLSIACLLLAWFHLAWLLPLVVLLPLALLGLWDVTQTRHSLLRNYPLIGHLRFLIEDTGPELRQYIVEANLEGRPFNRDQRSLMYQRAKDVVDKKPFGTELQVYDEHYGWLAHSMAPKPVSTSPVSDFRVDVGAEACTQPYAASIFNISSMSFGSMSANAVLALNRGAKLGRFAHWTGEGGVSRYHREPGGDLVWQIGTGYFGCRLPDGGFDVEQFRETARLDAVKMIEIKLSQGAKPGHGGILPGPKVSPEIAEARGVPVGTDCVSPAFHRAFTDPTGLCRFVAELRDASGGKPVGIKLCVGRIDELFAVGKAMLATGLAPDFITVDGAEGGTGAAPIEFSDHVGMPVREGVVLVHNMLVGLGLRDRVRVAAAGKLVSAFDIASILALGADWANAARGFMFAIGCIQAQACHTNECPVGVATQSARLQRALVPEEKSVRVANFHRNTVEALAEVIAAAGLNHPRELHPGLIYQRVSPTEIRSFAELYDVMKPGQLIEGRAPKRLRAAWERATPDRF